VQQAWPPASARGSRRPGRETAITRPGPRQPALGPDGPRQAGL
jgi:hypothetical protein